MGAIPYWSYLYCCVTAVCQALRIVTFSVTQLPGPSFHCRAKELSSRRPWPKHWTGHLVVDVGRQVSKSCGDLIFSSHTIFLLSGKRFVSDFAWMVVHPCACLPAGILTYNEYGSLVYVKAAAWALGMVVSCLIVASRKHYTVDVVIAWYTVPLVFYTLYRRWTTRRPISETFTMINNSDTCSNSSQLPSHVQMTLSEVRA